ncbi:immunity protein 38-domain-containing protein [Auriculariales sp. MPI-PUGE-AT-0066]|nr:immunity protein 38-domain-containing protein [Auriculariales sp. MPI-PUGE-AT-0066]
MKRVRVINYLRTPRRPVGATVTAVRGKATVAAFSPTTTTPLSTLPSRAFHTSFRMHTAASPPAIATTDNGAGNFEKPIKTLWDMQQAYEAICSEYLEAWQITRYRFEFHTAPQHDGSPHVEKHGDIWALIVTERGSENSRIESKDPDDILYELAEGIASTLGSKAEAAHRRPKEDSRRQMFARAEAMLRKIKPEWGDRYAADIADILSRHPYNDSN